MWTFAYHGRALERNGHLFYAIRGRNPGQLSPTKIDRLVAAGANVRRFDNKWGITLFCKIPTSKNESVERYLVYAVQSIFEGRVLAYIDTGDDVNITNNEGKTALFYAVQENNESVVRALIDAGADVNRTDNEGKTALLYAVQQSNNKSVVRALINAGADVNITDNEGKTVLFYAFQDNKEDKVRTLIEAGADVNVVDNEGNTLLDEAWKDGNASAALDLIHAGADVKAMKNVNKTDKENKSLLIKSIENKDLFAAVHLMKGGANVNITDNKGKTVLFYAVQQRNNESVVRVLIDAGADVNITDNEGKTALFYAVQQRDNESLVGSLIDAGALLNVRDHYGRTPLFYVIEVSSFPITYLLKKDANLGLEDNYRVLTFVIENFNEFHYDLRDVLKIPNERKKVTKKQILETIVNVAFCKSLCFKQSSGYYRVDADYLSALLRLANDYTSTSDVRKRKAIKKILNAMTDLQEKPIMEPEVIRKMLRRLVKLGANPNCVDSDGNTTLHHAIQLSCYGFPEETVLYICKQLKEMGASFLIKNLQNKTPLLRCLVSTIKNISSDDCRQRSNFKTQLAVCHFLMEHGSNVEGKTQNGQSALHLILELLRHVLLHQELVKKDLGEFIRLLRGVLEAYKEKGFPAVNKDNSGNTPLHLWAKLQLPPGQDHSSTIAEGYTFKVILQMILDHFKENKALLHVKNENGETSLHLCRTWTAVELLLDAGANPKDVDSSERLTLLFAGRNNNESVNYRNSFYPDILMASDTEFWRTVLKEGFNPWTSDRHGESALSVLLRSECHDLARALVDVACDQNSPANPSALFSLLTEICKDKSTNAHWKKDAAEMILSSSKCPVNGNDNEDSPLHYCCRNIVEVSKVVPDDEIQTTVHWSLAKLLRAEGADYRIPDATDKDCLKIAAECPALIELLKEPIDLDKFPKQIKNWKSVSKNHERRLQKVARHLESKQLESYWYHKDHLACGSFGAVFAGINEKDGREVAIKRIVKIRMERPEDEREITNLAALADCEQVVRYLLFFGDENFAYIILELMEGNLDELHDRQTISVDIRVKLCQDVVKGLKSLHDGNILHRDLKPTNILYKWHPKLCLKIADFGLSRHIDCNSTTVYGTNAGTRCWIAPEVLTSTKAHSKSSDVFACGLVIHYILTIKKHPFVPRISAMQPKTENNIMYGNMEGWDNSLCPEAAHLVKGMLDGDKNERPSADKALEHPFFWSKKKKLELLNAVGNQQEFGFPRARRPIPLTAVENDLEMSFGTIVKYGDWNDKGNAHMPDIYKKMRKKRKYDTHSVVELIRFIRNAYEHVIELPKSIQDQLMEDFVFFEYFPNLVMEVYKAVTTHGWHQTRKEIKHALI